MRRDDRALLVVVEDSDLEIWDVLFVFYCVCTAVFDACM